MDQGDEYGQYADASPVDRHTQFLDLTNGEGGDSLDVYDEEEMSEGGNEEEQEHAAPVGKGRFDVAIPGKVVESGHEHTGRWTKEEHEAFLGALRMYGKEWKRVAAKVKTRTVVQTRTHAQKYFQKLAKAMEAGKTDVTDVEMGVASEARRVASSQKKKPKPPTSGAKAPRQNSLANAAHLITNLSSTSDNPVANAAHLPPGAPTASIAFAKPQLPGSSLLKSSMFPARHGFSIAMPEAYDAPYDAVTVAATASNPSILLSTASSGAGFPMKIVAPEHDAASKHGKFPEPSPAACGKRKLAEIAAARMLAGVLSGRETHGKPLLWSAAAMDDGTATPPPEEATPVKTKAFPAAPMAARKLESTSSRKPMGLSLQIVNPETLGVSYEQQQKRRRDGQGSPQTPWEGELDALIRYVDHLWSREPIHAPD
jgi:SHAQKYF class myb-like DNA-binding protein